MKKDLAKIDLPELLEFAYEQGSFEVVPSKEGTARGHGLVATKGQTQIQLDMLLDQMRLIAKQAQEIKARVEISRKIYEATLNFSPDIGKRYHLYLRENGDCSLSLIAPEEWKRSSSFQTWLAEVELAPDHTWKVVKSSDDFVKWRERS